MAGKTRVVVLYGGKSTEHDISCRSAEFVLKNIDRKKYDVQAIAIDKSGHWIPQNTEQLIKNLNGPVSIGLYPLNRELIKLSNNPNPADFFKIGCSNTDEESKEETVFFPVLHGTYGEDGAMQGFFSLGDAAYVGSGILGSSVGMDKCVAKKLIKAAGISVVPWLEIRLESYQKNPDQFLETAEKTLKFPIFVKPTRLGSSVGISRAQTKAELKTACDLALSYDDKIMLEKGLDVREIECAALGGFDPEISEPGEVITHGDFYTYEAKYLNEDQATIQVPAELEIAQAIEAKKMSKKIFMELELYGMARIDLFLEKKTGKFYFNEVNTLPGFTEISQYPILWEKAGKPPIQLLDSLIELAISRRKIERKLQRSFSS